MDKEVRTSFFEKKGAPPGEAKKLLVNWASGVAATVAQIHKSFLLLFFKKEVLAYFLLSGDF